LERKAMELKTQKEKAAADAILKIERDANAKLQAEIRAEAEAKAKAIRDAEIKEALELKAEAKAAKAPRKQKLSNWVDSFSLPNQGGLNSDETAIEIIEKFESFKKWAKSKIEIL